MFFLVGCMFPGQSSTTGQCFVTACAGSSMFLHRSRVMMERFPDVLFCWMRRSGRRLFGLFRLFRCVRRLVFPRSRMELGDFSSESQWKPGPPIGLF